MFLHPQCPCSRASVAEFSEVLERNRDKTEGVVVFIQPNGVSADWDRTDLYRTVSQLPGSRLYLDRGGREAMLFKATTSGATLLYDAEGSLRFHGGVTAARGHLGDNPGRQALQRFFQSGKASSSETPVFGCPLMTPATFNGGNDKR
jgi:hypothetical protein